ncbi:MAG: rubrerythrin family protein [Bacteroides sp.]|jgi:rubrerythrin|nr:rubrerythrin family protein [Bacteroides sp.]
METKSIKGTQTERNLLKSFAGESQAARRYEMYAKVAKQEGYEQIAGFFMETADQERQHAKMFYSYLEGGMVEITASYPAGIVSTTEENLLHAAEGENEEWSMLYPEFARIAEEEGFKRIATTFKLIAAAEKNHEERYLKLLSRVKDGTVFQRPEKTKWYCRKCGYIYEGEKALKNCPTCQHPQAYFEEWGENY